MRSGSDLLHSLIDGHPQVLQMPGHWDPYGFWDVLTPGVRADALVDAFIRTHATKFDSHLNPRERWDALGLDGTDTFTVDVALFRERAIARLGDGVLTPATMIEAITMAYGEARGQDVSQGRVILVHAHHFAQLDRYPEDFGTTRVLCTVRDPRNGLLSWVRTLATHEPGELADTTTASQVERAMTNFLITVPGLRHQRNVSFVLLEDLHRNGERVMRDLSDQLGIDYESSLLESTVNGLAWGGDRSSGRTLHGLDPQAPALTAAYATGLSAGDRLLVEALLARPMRDLGYPVPWWMSALGRLTGPVLLLRTMGAERVLETHLEELPGGLAAAHPLARASRQRRRRSCLIRWTSLWRPRPFVGVRAGSADRIHW